MHPDGLLYRWISEGVPDRSMPAFRGRLTEEERWHVVNYLRVLALSSR
jgi:mono/diheme cytochrome c family protein